MPINVSDPTLLDMVKRTDPNGSIALIVEALSKRNPLIADAVAKEGNLATGHRFTTRNTLPAVGWRRFNDGVAPSKSTTEQFDETCGMLEGFSYVDCGLAKLNGNEAAFRSSEDKAFLQSLSQEATRAIMYSSVKTAAEEIHGFTPRFDLTTGGTAAQMVNSVAYTGLAAASGADQMSIWFVTWSEDGAYLIYPKGMTGGLSSEDLGKHLVDGSIAGTGGTSTGKKYTAWVTHWMWNLGLCISDQRQVVRVYNLDSSALAAATAVQIGGIVDAMIAAYYKLYDPNAGRTFVYCNRTIGEFLHRAAINKASGALSIDQYAGKPITTFLGYPIRMVDALTAAEALVA